MFSRPAPGLSSTGGRGRGWRRGLGVVAAATALALGVTACGGDSDKSDNAGQAGPAKQGGSVTIPTPVESRGLDPFTSSYGSASDGTRMAALYDFLVYVDPKTGTIENRIAESLTRDDTGKVWTLKLKPNVKFTDGTPYDAAAVKANWDANADPAMSSLRRAWVVGLTTEVVGPLELKATLDKPNMNFDRTVANGLTFIASPTAFKADPKGFSRKPVGAGPFMLKEWVPQDHQTMVRNPSYWQAGLPKLDQVTFKIMTDNQQIMNAMASGQVDLTVTTDEQMAVQAKDKNLKADAMYANGGQFFLMNSAKAPFDDPRARRAVAMALDPDDFMKTVFKGQVKAGTGIFPESSTFYDPSAPSQPKYNKDEAQRLFDELAAEGKPVNFTYLTQQQATARATAEYMQSRLNAYRNVKMEIEAVEIGAYITKGLVNRDYQAQNYGMWQADPDPSFDYFLRSGSAANFGNYANPAADAALDAARAAGTPEARKAAWSQLAKVLEQDLPLFVWQSATNAVVHRPNVVGAKIVNEGSLLMDQLGLSS